MSRDTRQEDREKALRREGWELKNHHAQIVRDALEDIRDVLESCGVDVGTMEEARAEILEILEDVVAESIDAATGPLRPVEENPSKGQRPNKITEEVIAQWRQRVIAAHHKLKAKDPSRHVAKGSAAEEAIVQATADRIPIIYSKDTITRTIMAGMPWPP